MALDTDLSPASETELIEIGITEMLTLQHYLSLSQQAGKARIHVRVAPASTQQLEKTPGNRDCG